MQKYFASQPVFLTAHTPVVGTRLEVKCALPTEMLTVYIQVYADKAMRIRHDRAKQQYCLTTEDLQTCKYRKNSKGRPKSHMKQVIQEAEVFAELCVNTQAVLAVANQKWGCLEGLEHQRALEDTLDKELEKRTAIEAAKQTAQQWVASAEGQAHLAQEARRAAQLCNYAASFDSRTGLSNRLSWAVTTGEVKYLLDIKFKGYPKVVTPDCAHDAV